MAEYTFEEFISTVQERIKEFLPDSYSDCGVRVQPIMKNNETLQGLIVDSPVTNVVPTIYLEGFYADYQDGMEMEEVLAHIAKCRTANENVIDFDLASISSFDQVKDKLLPRLMDREGNEQYLSKHPFKEMDGLAVVYSIGIGVSDDNGVMSIVVTDSLLENWQVSIEDLHAAAVENLQSIGKPTFSSLFDTLTNMLSNEELLDSMDRDSSMHDLIYVLSNESGMHGASSVLDEKVMDTVVGKLGPDFWVIPSSVHELLLIPIKHNGMELKDMEAMVKEVNDTQVAPQDRLSYHVYLYDNETKELFRADRKEEHELSKAASKESSERRGSLREQLGEKKAKVAGETKKAPAQHKKKEAVL